MREPVITVTSAVDHVEEVLTFTDMDVHYSYKKEGYPDHKVLDGPFLQNVKGERKCEGGYKDGEKDGVWSYYVNNPHHPMARDYFDKGALIKNEVLHNDGHHLRMMSTYDGKEHPVKRVTYGDDGQTIIKLDVFQNGLIKEENTMIPDGKQRIVYKYDDQFKLIEKRHFLNDELVKVETI
nr:uncharacterized protein [uncultured bacterium]